MVETKRNGKTLVIGSSNLDFVIRTQRFPAPGETLLGGEFSIHPGGKGANQAVATARFGAQVTFVTALGTQTDNSPLEREFAAAGIDLGFAVRPELPTGVAVITVDADGRNTIVVAPGANAAVSAMAVEGAFRNLLPTVVLASLEVPLECLRGVPEGAFLILNPAPAQNLPGWLLAKTDLLTPNETETEAICGVMPDDLDSCRKACALIREQGLAGAIIITLGSKGAYLSAVDAIVPAPTVTPIDTVAAGDCLNGVLAAELANGANLESALQMAIRAASLSVTRPGAIASLPFRAELG